MAPKLVGNQEQEYGKNQDTTYLSFGIYKTFLQTETYTTKQCLRENIRGKKRHCTENEAAIKALASHHQSILVESILAWNCLQCLLNVSHRAGCAGCAAPIWHIKNFCTSFHQKWRIKLYPYWEIVPKQQQCKPMMKDPSEALQTEILNLNRQQIRSANFTGQCNVVEHLQGWAHLWTVLEEYWGFNVISY